MLFRDSIHLTLNPPRPFLFEYRIENPCNPEFLGSYEYKADFTITAKEDLSAIEVRFLTFDLWGNHSRNLSSTDIVDISAGTPKIFKARWNVFSENEVSEFYASIAYIAQVRTKGGKVIKADPKVVLDEAKKFSIKFTEDDLEPKPEKK